MFGWIHESFRQLVNRKYGKDVWQKILHLSKFEDGTENEIHKYYKDEETFRLVNAMGIVIGIPVEEIWEAYGGFLIQYTMETGWDELLRAMSPDLEGFIQGLDSLHYFIDHVVYRTKLKGPAFHCEENDGALLLHYYSTRRDLYPIVKVARRIYDTEVVIKVQERKQDTSDSLINEHVTFLITQVEGASATRSLTSKQSVPPSVFFNMADEVNPVTLSDFSNVFPHHFCFDRELKLQHVGSQMQLAFPWIVFGKTSIMEVLELHHPEIPISFESFLSFRNSMFIFRIKESITGKENFDSTGKPVYITLKGSIYTVGNNSYMCYMCSLNVTSFHEIVDRNLFVSDIPLYDSTRDLIMLNQSRMSQVELNKRLEETTKNLKKMANELEVEKQRTEELLCELMPSSVADSLRQGYSIDAKEFDEATVLFTDIVTFTNICSLCTPYDVVNLLNDLYSRFDRLVGLHDVYKVETIGDAYMIAGGVPSFTQNHAEKVLNTSIGMLMESKLVLSPITRSPIRIRIGIHSGAVVAGVVGIKMPRYCLFGDTIYIANRMESNGIPGRIHVSESTKELAIKTNTLFIFEERGNIEIKDFGTVHAHFLEKNEKLTVWDICSRERSNEHTADGYQELHSDAGLRANNRTNSASSDDGEVSRELNGLNLNKKKKNSEKSSKTCQLL